MPGTLITRISQSVLDLFLPPSCFNCGSENSWLCQTCYNQIAFITSDVCNRCGTPIDSNSPSCDQCYNNPLQYVDGIRVASYFEDNPIRVGIHWLKYRNHKAVALPLSQILANAYSQYQVDCNVIIPVPLHTSRHKERGYNQCELLAKPLGKLLNLPVNTNTLQRTQKTKSQMTLGASERRDNVANAFSCRNNQLVGANVLLIDDVCTTGSTLDSCAVALKETGVKSVWGLTLAKAR